MAGFGCLDNNFSTCHKKKYTLSVCEIIKIIISVFILFSLCRCQAAGRSHRNEHEDRGGIYPLIIFVVEMLFE